MKVTVPLLLALALAGQAAPASASTHHHAAKVAKGKSASKAPRADKAGKARLVAAKPARPPIDYEGEDIHFGAWPAVREFEDDMAARHGYPREELDAIIDRTRFLDSAVELVKPAPPGKPKNWHAYSERFIEPIRIGAGVRFWNENADLLARAQET
jgi:membrane-bound lytic murein transglycosylase B